MATQKELEKLAENASSVVKDKEGHILSLIIFEDTRCEKKEKEKIIRWTEKRRKEVKANDIPVKKSPSSS